MTEDTGDAVAPALPQTDAELRAQLAAARRALQSAEARERALRGELQHRVRNMLAIVRSIFARTVSAGGELEDVANHFKARLDVLARYQVVRGVRTDGMTDFETMVHDELQSAQAARDPRVTCEGIEIRVPQDTAQLLGLALHELITNSIKFGTLSLPPDRGTLAIRWCVEAGSFRLSWRERGMAVLGAAPLRQGFGREFLEQALPYQLGGRSEFAITPGMVSCDIHVPLWDTPRPDSENQVPA
jgi:two-component sensor histidine kinase